MQVEGFFYQFLIRSFVFCFSRGQVLFQKSLFGLRLGGQERGREGTRVRVGYLGSYCMFTVEIFFSRSSLLGRSRGGFSIFQLEFRFLFRSFGFLFVERERGKNLGGGFGSGGGSFQSFFSRGGYRVIRGSCCRVGFRLSVGGRACRLFFVLKLLNRFFSVLFVVFFFLVVRGLDL